MKGKKQDREPEYIHWSECVCVCVCVCACVCVCVHSPLPMCMCVFLHVCMSVSHECAMRRRLKEARRRVSGVALSFLPLSSHRSRPNDGWRRMRSFLSWTADCSRLPSEDQPSAFHCRGRRGPLVLGLGFGYFGSVMGLQRQPGLEAGWAAEEWTTL